MPKSAGRSLWVVDGPQFSTAAPSASDAADEGTVLELGELPGLSGAISTISTSIVDLGELRLRSPLVVVLEEYSDEVVASWPETEAWGSGPTPADAVNQLKDEIVALYRELMAKPEAKLGKLPLRWKAALLAVVKEPDR